MTRGGRLTRDVADQRQALAVLVLEGGGDWVQPQQEQGLWTQRGKGLGETMWGTSCFPSLPAHPSLPSPYPHVLCVWKVWSCPALEGLGREVGNNSRSLDSQDDGSLVPEGWVFVEAAPEEG